MTRTLALFLCLLYLLCVPVSAQTLKVYSELALPECTSIEVTGTPEEGQTLTASATWTDALQTTYQWIADGEDIEGETDSTFDATGYGGVAISVREGAVNAAGWSYATSDPVTIADTSDPFTPNPPELFSVPYSLPTGGTTWTVNSGDNLQTTINNAARGDVIVVEAGATFSGHFELPAKSGSGWVYIISSAMASLPAEGTRVDLSDAANMPTISPDVTSLPALWTNFGASHYRICGINFSTAANQIDLVRTGHGVDEGDPVSSIYPGDTDEKLCDNIVIDRCIVQSTDDDVPCRVGVALNGHYMAVIDSCIANIKDDADSQAILTDNGGHAYKIVNNFLESSGENFLAGGTDPEIADAVSSDVEFRRNHCFKRLQWFIDDEWGVKNLFELKNAERVWIEGNILENNWTSAQSGSAILFTVRNQNGTAPWSAVRDVNFENNKIKNVGQGIVVTGEDDNQVSEQTDKIRIHNNLLENMTRDYTADGPAFLNLGTVVAPILHLTVTHNTFLSPDDEIGPSLFIRTDSFTVADGVRLKDNVFVMGSYNPDWTQLDNATIEGNALIMESSNPRYAENKDNFVSYFPGWLMIDSDYAAAGFVNAAGGDYSADTGSPLKNAASDGSDIGINQTILDAATAHAVDGDWN